MPNWCLNKLTISHEDRSKVMEFVHAYKEGKVCEHYLPRPQDQDWYEWNISNWGTKWDIGSDNNEIRGLHPTVVDNEASMSFDSAWSPPVGLYQKLVELGFSVNASYFEPGLAFCGIYEDGEDHYTDYSSKDMIPARIWDDFGLENFFSEDEEETV